MSKYLNESYTTKEGSVITPIRYFTKNQKGRYIIRCSECSLDTELFPEGSIETSGDSIRQKRTVCGCNPKGFRYSEEQYIILVKRECARRRYIFKGLEGFPCKAMDTYVKIYNPITDNYWDTTTIQTFLNGVGDPKEATERSVASSTKPYNEFIKRFQDTGKFLSGTVFIRSVNNTWKYVCPKCSTDEYVIGGVCSGVFSGTTGHLSEGKRSCRCGKPKWTKEQREFQINGILKSIGGGIFVGWDKRYVGRKGKIHWICKEGHENLTGLDPFLKRHNCKTCSTNGFKNHLPAKLYLTEWKLSDKIAIKYGITNLTVDSREHNQGRVTKFSPKRLYEFYHEDGKVVESCEKEIKKVLGGYYLTSEEFPRGYSETIKHSVSNITSILAIISKYGLGKCIVRTSGMS